MKLKTRPADQLPVEIAEEPVAPVSHIKADLTSAFPKGIYNSQQQAVVLGKKIGVGGEGTVYDLQGQPDLVAKIYHEVPAAEKAEKLIAMAQLGTEHLCKIAAWPVEVLRDTPDGNVIGFLMRKIGQAEEVHTLHSPKSRLKKFPDASWSFLIHVATNIARAVAALHEQGFVIGDVNPKNILVTKKATVYLLDCDSFQLSAAGKSYRCEGGFPEYTPPELQGLPFNEIDRTQEHDCFGLAVVIFQLLFLGRHPYSGRFLGAGEMPLEKAMRERRFAYGTDAATRQMQPPPGTLSFDALPATLTELLRRAFLATDRPPSHEWITPLTQLASSLQRCVLHSGHYYHEALTECPWCQIETRARIRLFNFNPAEARQSPSAFRLDEIWAQVEKLQSLESHEQHVTVVPQLSPAVIEYAKEMRVRKWLGIIFAGLGGVFSAMVGGFCASFWLLPLVLLTVRWIAGATKERDDKAMQTLFTAQFDIPNLPLAKIIVQRRKEADDYIRETEPKLVSPKEAQSYAAKVQDLNAKLWDYEALPEASHHKSRLEHAITSSAQYLHHLKQQLEARQQQVLPALTKAKQAVAEADKNLEVLSWRNRPFPITLTLIVAFVLTLFFVSERHFMMGAMSPESSFDDVIYSQPPTTTTSSTQSLLTIEATAPSNVEASYRTGKEFLDSGNTPEAKNYFLIALAQTPAKIWTQLHPSLYYDLCHVRVFQGEGKRFIELLEADINRSVTPEADTFQLAILYAMTGEEDKAVAQYRILHYASPQLAEQLETEMRKHGLSLKNLSEQ